MSLPYEKDKIMTENPFIDLLVYNIKVLGYGCVVKDQVTADTLETIDSLKESAIYIACIEGHAELGLFTTIPHSFLVQVGMTDAQIKLYEDNGYDQYYIPDQYHTDLVALLTPWYISNYKEKNEYYRMITGMPPVGDPGIPIRDYEYLIPDDISYTGNYFHSVGYQVCRSFEAAGVLDVVRADYPKAKYLNYLTQGISLYEARNKLDFQILWNPETMNSSVTEEFKLKYAENRKYLISTVYSSAMEIESEYYHSFMMAYLILITMIDMLVDVQAHIIKKDILDRRCVEFIFSMYGVPYYHIIPYKYQERMCKNIYSLLKFKSCTKDMLSLTKVFGFEDMTIFKWYLLKVRKINAWGEFEYASSKQLICKHNDIIDHQFSIEKASVKPARGPIPDDISTMNQYYPGSGIADDYNPPVENATSSITGSGNTGGTDSTVSVQTSADSTTPTYELHANERFIPFPFDYFLQKGNVMFVRFDDYVLRAGIDYTIHSYNVIRFLKIVDFTNINEVRYDFYYDKETVNSEFAIDKDHCVRTIQQKLKYNGTRTYNLKPVPIDRYYTAKNQVIVSLNTTWLPSESYSIDYENEELIFDDAIELDEHSDITLIYIYSKHLKSRYAKASVTLEEDHQEKIFIPEPFIFYTLNGNTFYLTLGSTYISSTRYDVYPSKEEGKSYVVFKDKTPLIKGMDIVFNFLYSTNAIYDKLTVEEKVISITATKPYQYEFHIDFPVEHYVESEYKVFIKILGWWLPARYYTIIGKDTLVFTDRSIALQPGRTMEVHLVYMPADRTKKLNLLVTTDSKAATREKQKNFTIDFPTSHYFTKGNKLIVDMEGYPLVEGTDYTLTLNEDETSAKLKILPRDLRPSIGQRVNYTFYHNKEADYFITIDAQDIILEKTSKEDFSIPWPFYPYLETNQDFLVVVGTTLVPKSRILMTSRFNFRILGLDPNVIGRKVTVLFIYSNWYTINSSQKLIVEWKDHMVYEDKIDIETPFQYYIENDWDYFVTYNNRTYMHEDKYDVYNSTFYTAPVADLMAKKYGSLITFVFIYVKKYPYVQETISEDFSRTTDLYFSKCPVDDIYSSQYLKDKSNWRAYDPIAIGDGWWDGRFYKIDSHNLVKQAIYEEKFNYARSKFYGVSNVMELGEYSNQMSYFFSMLYDDVLLEKNVNVLVPSLSPSHKFNIAHLFIFMTSLNFMFNGYEDFILDTPTKILYVNGFNFKANLDELKSYLEDHHFDAIKDFPIWDIILPTTQIPDFANFINIYKTNYAVRKLILKGMVESQDYREYALWKHLYDALLIWKLNFEYFKLDNGEVAKTYTEFLKEKENLLYQAFKSIKAINDPDEKQDTIINTCDSIIYILEEYMKGDEFKYIFDQYPGHSASNAAKYLHMMIDFFKSYKIVLMPRCETLNVGNDPNDPDNYFRPIDVMTDKEYNKMADYFPPMVEVVRTTEHMKLEEYGMTENKELPLRDFPIIDPEQNAPKVNILEKGYWMKEDVSIQLSSEKKRITIEFPCQLKVDKIDYSNDILPAIGEYVKQESNGEFAATADIHYEVLNKDLDSAVTMSDYIKMMIDLNCDFYLDGRLFLAGYKMSDVYRPIYTTMKSIPDTDISDLNTRLDDRLAFSNIQEMFMDCAKLEVIPEGLNFADVNGKLYFDDMHDFAMNCASVTSVSFPVTYLPDNNNKKDLSRLFYGCNSLSVIANFQLSSYDTSLGDVILDQAFYSCTALTKGPIYIRAMKYISMQQAFYGCRSLITPPKIDSMYGDLNLDEAFRFCSNLQILPSIYFPVSQNPSVKMAQVYMRSTFADCLKLVDVKTNGDLIMNSVEVHMINTFQGCLSLVQTPRMQVKSSSVVVMDSTYSGCKALTTVNEIELDKASILYLDKTYKGCQSLKTAYAVYTYDKATVYMTNTFEGCTSLNLVSALITENLDASEDKSYYLKETFKDCTSLKSISLQASTIKSIDNIFSGCTSLQTVTFVKPNATIEPLLTHANLDNNTLSYEIKIEN